ncbi:MAG: Flagellar hook-associated protein 3 [Betaproteobacteria bacterium ADurb.Bin341]|nr:MAG: Flagellar hook-associated protein 3 [Betaproteobacteria bacterium ADurb.Bin341]
MRVSSNQIFQSGVLGVSRNQADLLKLQNQLSTGRRVLTPADDPVAAAQAVVVAQSQSVNVQHLDAQGNAKSQLTTVEGYLSSLTDLLQNVRERLVQAGNSTLNAADRRAIGTELQARLEALTGLANATDGRGEFLFSGFKGDTRPFAIDPVSGDMAYFGDSGERKLQVDGSRQMSTSIAGDDLFMRVRNGNGAFQVQTGGNVLTLGINQGTAKMDSGSVTDVASWRAAMANTALWNTPANAGDLRVEFTVIGTTTTYQIYDVSNPATPEALLAAPVSYVPGQAIALQKTTLAPPPAGPIDFGANVVIDGVPANGDSFTISQSSNQSMFETLQNLVAALNAPVSTTTYTWTEYYNTVSREMANVDQALENVSRVRSLVGTRMNDLDSLGEVAEDNKLQYASRLSELQDLDYAKAISDFTQKQMQLEAALSSFAKTGQLSLFNYL